MIKPLGDCILVKEDPKKEHAFLVGLAEETFTGEVLAVGPGKKLPDGKIRKMLVNVGDRIRFSGTIDAQIDGLILMRDKDVIGLV
jgi:chaperonin GroES